MFKTGIYSTQQWVTSRNTGGSRKAVSYGLLRSDCDPAQAVSIFEETVRLLPLSSGICRTTYRQRFSDVDEKVATLLRERFPSESELEIQDWAASDCLASAEWAGKLSRDFPECRVIASDQMVHLIEATKDHESYFFEPNGAALQYVRPPFVISLIAKNSLVYPVNRLLALHAHARVNEVRSIVLNCSWADLDDQRAFVRDGWHVSRLSLIHPEAMRLRQTGTGFDIRVQSAFQRLSNPCDVIRTMNILNRCYFPPEKLLEGIASVFASLQEGGLWIVGWTDEDDRRGQNNVTVYGKIGTDLTPLARMNQGSEIEDLTAEFCRSAAGAILQPSFEKFP